jgi:hypothetical protein
VSERLQLSRREFGLGLGATPVFVPAPAPRERAPWDAPAEVRKVFVGVPKPTWPRPDLNFEQEMAGISANLAGSSPAQSRGPLTAAMAKSRRTSSRGKSLPARTPSWCWT